MTRNRKGRLSDPGSLNKEKNKWEAVFKDWAKIGTNQLEENVTVVVVKTYGNWTEWMDFIVARYSKQLAPLGIQLHVLWDTTNKEPPNVTFAPAQTMYTPAWGQDNLAVPVCELTWSAVVDAFGGRYLGMELHQWVPTSYEATSAQELLWWKHCFPEELRTKRYHVWFIEHDAFFNGDLAKFVKGHFTEDADYVARGFRIAGTHWWKYAMVTSALGIGVPTLSVLDNVVKNVFPLPTLEDGECSDGSHDLSGVLFAQEHVTRYSSAFFYLLDLAAVTGTLLPGESMGATLCATMPLLTGEPCTLYDLAPVMEHNRHTTTNWVSPIFCWLQDRPEPGRANPYVTDDLPCSEQWRDKWVHPVKVANAALRLQEC